MIHCQVETDTHQLQSGAATIGRPTGGGPAHACFELTTKGLSAAESLPADDTPEQPDKAVGHLGNAGIRPSFRTAKEIEDVVGTAWASAARLTQVCGKDLKDWLRRWYEKLPSDQQKFARQPIKEPRQGAKDEYKVSMLAPKLCAHLRKHS